MKQPNRSMKPTSVNENTRRQAAPFPEYVDSFTPAHSAFGLPMYVAPLPLAPFRVFATTPCCGYFLSRYDFNSVPRRLGRGSWGALVVGGVLPVAPHLGSVGCGL